MLIVFRRSALEGLGSEEDSLSARRVYRSLSKKEAMVCVLPPVVSLLDGIAAELIREGETGIAISDPERPE